MSIFFFVPIEEIRQ